MQKFWKKHFEKFFFSHFQNFRFFHILFVGLPLVWQRFWSSYAKNLEVKDKNMTLESFSDSLKHIWKYFVKEKILKIWSDSLLFCRFTDKWFKMERHFGNCARDWSLSFFYLWVDKADGRGAYLPNFSKWQHISAIQKR